MGDIGARDLRAARVELERDETASGDKPARQPDRAVASERADLEDAPGADHLRQKHQQLALIGRDIDRRQACRFARLERCGQRRIVAYEMVGDIAVDRGPQFVGLETLHHKSFPGLRIPFGSNAALILRISSSSIADLA